MSITPSALTESEIALLLNDAATVAARQTLDDSPSHSVSFTIQVPDAIKEALKSRIGLDLYGVKDIPMRWIKGDTAAHADRGLTPFTYTYLVYLTDNTGSFVVNNVETSIQRGQAIVFEEGLRHETRNTGTEPRLMLGPMSEAATPVGAPTVIYYYATQADADGQVNSIASSTIYSVGPTDTGSIGTLSSWYIASNSTGPDSGGPYSTGASLTPAGVYNLYVIPAIYYYATKEDANAQINIIAISDTIYTLGNVNYGSIDTIASWNIATNSTGPTTGGPYTNGYAPSSSGIYNVYPFAAPCFLEGSTLLCQVNGAEVYVPIEQLRKGTLVKTVNHGYKAVDLIGKSKMYNPGHSRRSQDRLYRCSKKAYPELTTDLIITGCHSILVDTLTAKQREDTIERLEKVFVTDGKYRLMACVDERAEPYAKEGVHTIWHVSLDTDNIFVNYGVYANGGLLVETICKRRLRDLSGMELV